MNWGDKRVNELIRQCEKLGGWAEHTGSGHIRIHGPKGFAYVSSTPGRGRSMWNSRANIRKYAGLAI